MKKLGLAAAILVAMSSPGFAQSLGDVLYLKSGGPPMTVTEVIPPASVGVRWFSGGSMQAATYPTQSTTATDPGPSIAKAALTEKCRVFPTDPACT